MLYSDKKMYRRVYKALNKYIKEREQAMAMDVKIDAARRLKSSQSSQKQPRLSLAY